MCTRSLSIVAVAVLAAACTSTTKAPVAGVDTVAAAGQLALEERFAATLDQRNLRLWLQELSAHPHHTGSPGAQRVAENLLAKFRSWGYDAHVETFYGLISEPRELRVEMLAPRAFRAALEEPAVPGRVPEDRRGSLPPFNAFSKDGDVTAEAVYVNYGLPEDYAWLAREGISVKGKIAVARYGRAYRGIKPRLAYEQGAVGVILYSDPADYGAARGEVYPAGPFLPDAGYQRGTVIDITRAAGDPLSPDKGADSPPESWSLSSIAERISPVPVLPLSARDARPILEAMTGATVPEGWRGGLGIAYRAGGNVTLRLKVLQDWKVAPLHNVVAKLEGAAWPDEWVLHGNNHDAWNYGAMVAGSGLVTMLEEARAIGVLAQSGWRPRRTIVFLAWDGESQGLLGSTEWAEAHAAELQSKAVAYLNTGITTRGWLEAGGSHVLERLVNEVSRDVRDTARGASVHERWAAHVDEAGAADRGYLQQTGRVRLAALGLGSDFTPFLQHLGIATLDYGFGGEADSGVYNSIYDTFDFYDRFGDPGYAYGKLLAETSGRTVLRLANADVLPFDFLGVAAAVSAYLAELKALARERGADQLDWAELERAAASLRESAERYSRASRSGVAADVARLNGLLRSSEQLLAPAEGLPGRPWFRHHLYAPGLHTGYGVKTLPGVREALERGQWAEARIEIGRVAGVLARYASRIDDGSTLFETGAAGNHTVLQRAHQ